ncbi:HD domain-containing protein [Actinomycetes bacterium KLBMP 9797]
MSTVAAPPRVGAARALAAALLHGLPDRLAHTAAVARRAGELVRTVDPGDREMLVATAWLHDIGYSPTLCETGFHSLDGAAYLQQQGWPDRVCGLVAHHSGAVFVARARRMADALARFRHEESPVSDALTYADQTVGPRGQRMSLEERLTEVLARHGAHSAHAQVHPLRSAHIRDAAHRVEQRMSVQVIRQR